MGELGNFAYLEQKELEEYDGSCHYSQLYIKRQGAWTSFDKRWGIVAGFSAREHPGRAYVISWITVEWCVNESVGGHTRVS